MARTVWTGFRLASFLAVSTFGAHACSRFARREVSGTDSRFLNNVSICTHGISGIFTPPEGSNANGLDKTQRGQVFQYSIARSKGGHGINQRDQRQLFC